MTKRELERLEDLLLKLYESKLPVPIHADISRIRHVVTTMIEGGQDA